MDRFIVVIHIHQCCADINLKSSMDRFIAFAQYSLLLAKYLKSSMDRFID